MKISCNFSLLETMLIANGSRLCYKMKCVLPKVGDEFWLDHDISTGTGAYPLCEGLLAKPRRVEFHSPAREKLLLVDGANAAGVLALTMLLGRIHQRSVKLERTTLTELNAIANPAIIGCKW